MEWLKKLDFVEKCFLGYLSVAVLCFGLATVTFENRGFHAPGVPGMLAGVAWPLWLSYEVSWAIFGKEKQDPDFRIKKVEK